MKKMNKTLDFLKKENDKYLNIIISKLEEKNISDEQITRVEEELNLIYEGNNSEIIYECLQLALFCKQNNEPYSLNGTISSLLILYLLGVSKVNPCLINARYETGLGIPYEAKSIYLEMRVREAFLNKMVDKAIEINDGKYEPFFQIMESRHSEPPYPVHISFLPNTASANKYFELEEKNGKHFIKKWVSRYSDVPGFSITICPSKLLNDCFDILKDKPNIQFIDGLQKMNYELHSNNFDVIGGIDEEKSIALKDNYDLNDLISLFCMIHNTYDNFEPEKSVFFDRDSVFEYFMSIGLSKTNSFHLMENVRKGIFREESVKHLELPQEIINDFKNIKYLWPRAAAFDLLYYYLIKCADNK